MDKPPERCFYYLNRDCFCAASIYCTDRCPCKGEGCKHLGGNICAQDRAHRCFKPKSSLLPPRNHGV